MGLPQLLFTLDHAAQLTGLSPGTLRYYCWSGRLHGTRPGKIWLVSRRELERFFQIDISAIDRQPRRTRRRKRSSMTTKHSAR